MGRQGVAWFREKKSIIERRRRSSLTARSSLSDLLANLLFFHLLFFDSLFFDLLFFDSSPRLLARANIIASSSSLLSPLVCRRGPHTLRSSLESPDDDEPLQEELSLSHAASLSPSSSFRAPPLLLFPGQAPAAFAAVHVGEIQNNIGSNSPTHVDNGRPTEPPSCHELPIDALFGIDARFEN